MARDGVKVKKRSVLAAPLAFIGFCVLLVFAMSIMFRVGKIEVRGAEFYTEEEVRVASGIDEGDNLFFINRFSVISGLFKRLPYIETASVTRYLPNRVIITVTESKALSYVSDGTQEWVIDRNGKVLKQAAQSELDVLIEVRGVTALSPEIGKVIVLPEDETGKLAVLTAVLDQIQERGILSDVSEINLRDDGTASIRYAGRFTVELGYADDMEYKFGKLLSAAGMLTDGDQGTIDVSADGNRAVFSPG